MADKPMKTLQLHYLMIQLFYERYIVTLRKLLFKK